MGLEYSAEARTDMHSEREEWKAHLGQVAFQADVAHMAALKGTVASDYMDWDDYTQVKAPIVQRYVTIGCAVEDAIYASMKTLPGRLRAYSKEAKALRAIQSILNGPDPDLAAIAAMVERGLGPERGE